MKKWILLIASVISFQLLSGQSVRLVDILQEPSPGFSVEAHMNERGGTMAFNIDYGGGCVGGYQIKVTFSKSLTQLQAGETFLATLACEDCNTPCTRKWKIAALQGAGGVPNIAAYPDYVYNGNIHISKGYNGYTGVNDWNPGQRTAVVPMVYEPKKDVAQTALQFVIGSGLHKVIYVFQADPAGTPSLQAGGKPNLNCVWESSYGAVNWSEGYYGSRDKTLSGELHQKNGEWVYEGTWGRKSGSRWGRVRFVFDSPTTFTGYWTEGEGTRQTRWTGSGNCLIVKH
ncbi:MULTISPECIES: hypothetical protein [unclassified Robiginitalea]|uniref:hypothetical protein n=1 Tax=Robiginitalea TaxID=252306 RepID=UPI002349569D|nr:MULTISPECIES: hypothetical protein [unclassified Robiginitalea]MDC6355133.1 hypothetical protein [Robiginitalea sp. PM2]MDC6375652.1 hypothetical protein [Robiginitalea sp. SP8]